MTLEDFSDISQIVASIGVLISLIYLAVQTRHATKSHLAQMHQQRNAQVVDLMVRSTEPSLQTVIRDGAFGDTLSPVDATRYFNYTQAVLRSMDEQFIAQREGMLREDRWRKTEVQIERMMTLPGIRAVYMMLRDAEALDKGFTAMADKLLAAGRTRAPVDGALRWTALAAEERALSDALVKPAG
jgi:hypothetical protein